MIRAELLNQKESILLEFLSQIPPDLMAAERFLKEAAVSVGEINEVAVSYADMCFWDVVDFEQEHATSCSEGIVPDLHSTYILEVLELLLRFGLDPNGFVDGNNIMDSLRYVENELLAADALVLLLEHGGRADLFIPEEGETLFRAVDFDICYGVGEQSNRRMFTSWVHCWMVLVGYGARYSKNIDENNEFMKIFPQQVSKYSGGRFDLRKLKNHRDYFFGISAVGEDVKLSIYDRETLWEVVELRC